MKQLFVTLFILLNHIKLANLPLCVIPIICHLWTLFVLPISLSKAKKCFVFIYIMLSRTFSYIFINTIDHTHIAIYKTKLWIRCLFAIYFSSYLKVKRSCKASHNFLLISFEIHDYIFYFSRSLFRNHGQILQNVWIFLHFNSFSTFPTIMIQGISN